MFHHILTIPSIHISKDQRYLGFPVGDPVPPALTTKATPSTAGHIPVNSSSGASQPSITSSDPVVISIHSKMIHLTKQRDSTSEVHSFKEVTVHVPYGTLWKPMERLFHVHSVSCKTH